MNDLIRGPWSDLESPRTAVPRRMTVAATYPIFPPRGGGQCRIFQLYRHLARFADIEVVTIGAHGEPPFEGQIAPSLREVRIPKSSGHQQAEARLQGALGVDIADVAATRLYSLTPDYVQALAASAALSEVVVLAHPFLLPAVREVCELPIWYEAQDIEWHIKRQTYPRNVTGRELLESVRQVEADCCAQAGRILVCSPGDGQTLTELYGVDPARVAVVPNGADLEQIRFVTPQSRARNKAALGIADRYVALFIGSWHGPNLEAVRSILRAAPQLNDVLVVVVGSAGHAFDLKALPSNVAFLGSVDDATKDLLLASADVALNPVISGSGTNLKMLEYFAAGIPVISSPVGLRGLDGAQAHVVVADGSGMARAIEQVRHEPSAMLAERTRAARQFVEQHFDWKVIVDDFVKWLEGRGGRGEGRGARRAG